MASAAADKREQDVANAIDASGPKGLTSKRPKVSTSYPDVLVEYKNFKGVDNGIWVEVKMNHTDNLMNPRYNYVGGRWEAGASYRSDATEMLDKQFNESKEGKRFIEGLKAHLISKGWKGDVRKLTLYSTKTERAKDPNSVSLELMKSYLATLTNKNIMKIGPIAIGPLVTKHYLEGKARPAYYLQSANDFYTFGKQNPLKLPSDVPEFKDKAGYNTVVLRIGDRSGNFEIQTEVKCKTLSSSPYSVLPGKKNPFIGLK